MKKYIINIASKKLNKLSNKYNKFVNVFVDDWRGCRYIFDTQDVRNCKNDCLNCDLYKLLKNEKEGEFSSALYPASPRDKELFGLQNFLNCKTLQQYNDCYANYLINETNSKEEIFEELKLIKQVKIIYSNNNNVIELENNFKKEILQKVLNNTSGEKRLLIMEAINNLNLNY